MKSVLFSAVFTKRLNQRHIFIISFIFSALHLDPSCRGSCSAWAKKTVSAEKLLSFAFAQIMSAAIWREIKRNKSKRRKTIITTRPRKVNDRVRTKNSKITWKIVLESCPFFLLKWMMNGNGIIHSNISFLFLSQRSLFSIQLFVSRSRGHRLQTHLENT